MTSAKEPHEPLSDRMVTPERSVFGTRAPRPPGVGRHLVVVFILSALAIGVALFFAQRAATVEVPTDVQDSPDK